MPKNVGLLPVAPVVPKQPMFRSLAIAASGLSAQRQRMETVASNIANAETTRGPDGAPYRRRVTVLEAGDQTEQTGPLAPGQPVGSSGPFHGVPPFEVPSGKFPADITKTFQIPVLETRDGTEGVRIAGVVEDQTEGPLVYDPGHPDANEQGYVRYPNVRITDELVDMMDARRIYEANATVFQSAKAMLRRALDI
jgi:flagellar basal-body rod protein FlgC